MQRRIRAFVAEYNRRYDATILLTSHYMADVEALCQRVIVIHHGTLLYDGELARLVQQFTAHKTIVVQLADTQADLRSYGDVISHEDGHVTLPRPQGPDGTRHRAPARRSARDRLARRRPSH